MRAMTTPLRLSLADARRIAIEAQGFATPRLSRTRNEPRKGEAERILALVSQLGVVQLDSVNVVARAHYLPIHARLGHYTRQTFDDAIWGESRPRALFEYWGHEASILPVGLQPLFRWRMDRAAAGTGIWKHIARFGRERKAFVDEVLAEVRRRGPTRASEIEGAPKKRGGRWWSRSEGKHALEWLFWLGAVSTSTRKHFERIYDVTERVVPAEILATKTPPEAEAHRALLAIAARALGVATEEDLRDYYRLSPKDARPRLPELVEEGVLVPATVEGWDKPAYVSREAAARSRRRSQTSPRVAFLAPFDPLVWFRARALRLFDFHYRIEIYTPAAARTHGYYVLPVLVGDGLPARVDMKANRESSTLLVHGAWLEKGIVADDVAAPIAEELQRFAMWLGLEKVSIARKGNLASSLRGAFGALR